jgi:energy-coupling factor transport system permease protein
VPAVVLVMGGVQGWPGIVPAQTATLPPVPVAAALAVLVAAAPAVFTPRPRAEVPA